MEYFDMCIKTPLLKTKVLYPTAKKVFMQCFSDFINKNDVSINVFCCKTFKTTKKSYFTENLAVCINLFDKKEQKDITNSSNPIEWKLSGFIEHCKTYRVGWLYQITQKAEHLNCFYFNAMSMARLNLIKRKNKKRTIKDIKHGKVIFKPEEKIKRNPVNWVSFEKKVINN